MSPNDIWDIIWEITYKPGWKVLYFRRDNYLQLEVKGTDSVTHKPTTWKSGKRYLSKFMCRQEIVGIVFDMIKAAELHEVHEWFRYKGASIYNPHLDPDVLAEVASKKSSFVVRENAMTMVEIDDET